MSDILKKRVFSRQDKTQTARESEITEVVTAYQRMFPFEMKEAATHAKMMRGTRAKPTGEMLGGDDVDFVFTATLPGPLMRALQKIINEPPIFHDQKELRWFLRRWPEFRAADKI